MPALTACPDVQIYLALLSGRPLAADAEPLLEHLENCDTCASRLRDSALADDLAPLLRNARDLTATPMPEAVRGLAERLSRLRPCDTLPHPGEYDTGGAGKENGPSVAAARYPFLEPAESPDELGRLGRYRVLRVLGEGGMGVVFVAEDPRLGRKVALKTMLPQIARSANARQRFLREARTIAAVEHDHIVPIFEVDEANGVPYLAMPLLKGQSLAAYLKEQGATGAVGEPLPVPEIWRIGREMAAGLAAAHDTGVIHRDIKPGNVWLEGEHLRVRILDFGLARAEREDQVLTQPGSIVGTPAYMSPEQAEGLRVDARGDLFSLGCVLYRLCTGRTAFHRATTTATLHAVRYEEPPPPHDLNPAIPLALSDLIVRLLAKDPEARPGSAREVGHALTALGHGNQPTEPFQDGPAPAPPGRAWRRWAAAVAGLALLELAIVAPWRDPASTERPGTLVKPSPKDWRQLFANSHPFRTRLEDNLTMALHVRKAAQRRVDLHHEVQPRELRSLLRQREADAGGEHTMNSVMAREARMPLSGRRAADPIDRRARVHRAPALSGFFCGRLQGFVAGAFDE